MPISGPDNHSCMNMVDQEEGMEKRTQDEVKHNQDGLDKDYGQHIGKYNRQLA